MKRILISICLVLCLLAGSFPAATRAEGNDAAASVCLDLADGSIRITENGYTQGASTTEFSGAYIVTQTGDSPTSSTITVESGAVDLTASGLNVEAADGPAILVMAGAALHLTTEGENTVSGGPGYAAVSVAAGWNSDGSFSVEHSGRLVIQGTGSLTVRGGKANPDRGIGGGAGIGGDGFGTGNYNGGDFGAVEILGGTVTAVGGSADGLNHGAGAGIGGGGGDDCGEDAVVTVVWAYAGSVSIQGGTVVAQGGAAYYDCCAGAGIGSGSSSSNHGTRSNDLSISITGGVVDAQGGSNAAAIGGGVNGDCGNITITGGKVTALGGGESSASAFGGAGIGGGDSAGGGSISIGGSAEVFARGGGAAAGIGGGNGGHVAASPFPAAPM